MAILEFVSLLKSCCIESYSHHTEACVGSVVSVEFLLVALLYESVSVFEDTWIECLGEGFNI